MLLERVGSRRAQISEMSHGLCFEGIRIHNWKEEVPEGRLLGIVPLDSIGKLMDTFKSLSSFTPRCFVHTSDPLDPPSPSFQ